MLRVVTMLTALLPILFAVAPLAAHDGQGEPSSTAQSGTTFPTGLILPALPGPKPWSDKPVLNDPQRFQIAIMTDRTGGHRPGIWMQAVRHINLLRPQFVMSVGDLIEGYTEDQHELERQWAEFAGFIEKMEMRFFFVAGNHDVTNPLMHRLWREKFGKEWYSFDYQGVHFVCLSSEDPVATLGDEQLAWLAEDLRKSASARWTLLFLHKPLWVYAEREMAVGNPDPTNWRRVEELLGERPCTVFAGHVHHYVQFDRRGRQYYQLATTGGSSQLRGIPYGEFDHITWLTMEQAGPSIAHLLLDGILAPDVVTEEGIARFRRFLETTYIEIAPILLESGEAFTEGQIHLRLTNEFDRDVEISGQIAGLPLRGLTVEPAELSLSAEAQATAELSVSVSFAEAIDVPQLVNTVMNVKLRSLGEDPPLVAERVLPVIIDRRFHSSPIEAVADGDLSEWPELPYEMPDSPLVIGDVQSWNGAGDASVRFAVGHDEQHLYFAAEVVDDTVIAGDAVTLYVDGRPIQLRAADSRLRRGALVLRAAPEFSDDELRLAVSSTRRSDQLVDNVERAARRTSLGYQLELAVPLENVVQQQGDDWHSIQLALVLDDVDEAGQELARVVWHGTRNLRSNRGFAHFVRE